MTFFISIKSPAWKWCFIFHCLKPHHPLRTTACEQASTTAELFFRLLPTMRWLPNSKECWQGGGELVGSREQGCLPHACAENSFVSEMWWGRIVFASKIGGVCVAATAELLIHHFSDWAVVGTSSHFYGCTWRDFWYLLLSPQLLVTHTSHHKNPHLWQANTNIWNTLTDLVRIQMTILRNSQIWSQRWLMAESKKQSQQISHHHLFNKRQGFSLPIK